MIPRYAPNFGIRDLVRSLRFSEVPGPLVDQATALLRILLDRDHVVPTASGRGALWLLLLALDEIGMSGRVILPGYTCNAVQEAALLAGREVMNIDHAQGEINLSARQLTGKINANDIVIATHQYGYTCDIKSIVHAANDAGAVVIEDIAAALQGTIDGQKAGTFGIASFGSFDSSKLIHVPPKAGFVATSDPTLAKAIENAAAHRLTMHSMNERLAVWLEALALVLGTMPLLYKLYYLLAFKFTGRTTAESSKLSTSPNRFYLKRFSDWQASILLPQLRGIEMIESRREAIMKTYRRSILSSPAFGVCDDAAEKLGSVIRFPIFVKSRKIDFHRLLAAHGIDTGFSFSHLAASRDAKNSWAIADSVLNLPTHPTLSDKDVTHIITTVMQLSGR